MFSSDGSYAGYQGLTWNVLTRLVDSPEVIQPSKDETDIYSTAKERGEPLIIDFRTWDFGIPCIFD